MKNSIVITALASCALFAAAVQADDTVAKKEPATTLTSNAAQPAGNTAANKKATVSAEGAHDTQANTGMKASGAALNKSEGANDHQH